MIPVPWEPSSCFVISPGSHSLRASLNLQVAASLETAGWGCGWWTLTVSSELEISWQRREAAKTKTHEHIHECHPFARKEALRGAGKEQAPELWAGQGTSGVLGCVLGGIQITVDAVFARLLNWVGRVAVSKQAAYTQASQLAGADHRCKTFVTNQQSGRSTVYGGGKMPLQGVEQGVRIWVSMSNSLSQAVAKYTGR